MDNNDRQSDTTNGHREGSTSGTGGEGSDSSTFGRARAQQPQGRVPEYVDMVIPDYENAANENAARRAGRASTAVVSRSGNSNDDSAQNNEEGKESLTDESRTSSSNEESELVPAETDVLLNDGNEDHPGNVSYAAVTRHLAKKYTKVKIGYRRAAVQILVTAVKAQGGRFLESHREGHWREVSDRKAYSKSSRAIRSTCRKVEAGSSSRSRRQRTRRSPKRQDSLQGENSSGGGSLMNSTSEGGNDQNSDNNSHTNLQMVALRLQTRDQSLIHLNLDLAAVNHDCIFPFAKSLESSDLLQSLDIKFSHLNRTNANALAWGIKHCKGLRQIRLSYGKWGEKVSIVLASILENPSIESLNLDKNDIGTNLIKIIYRMISNSKNCQLCRLSLEDNPINNEGATVLAKLIAHSKTLTFLSIGGNNLEANGMETIRNASNKKKTCMFEVSGLESVGSRKRPALPHPSEDSEEHTAKKPRGESYVDSELAQTSSTSSADGARTSSDNTPSSNGGTDDNGPASSMNDSGSGSDGPTSSSSS